MVKRMVSTSPHFLKTSLSTLLDIYYLLSQNSKITLHFSGFLDGEKIVCMDNLHEAVKTDTCLIYSFGLGDDWDFELSMNQFQSNSAVDPRLLHTFST